jgi:hypothetical protein
MLCCAQTPFSLGPLPLRGRADGRWSTLARADGRAGGRAGGRQRVGAAHVAASCKMATSHHGAAGPAHSVGPWRAAGGGAHSSSLIRCTSSRRAPIVRSSRGVRAGEEAREE